MLPHDIDPATNNGQLARSWKTLRLHDAILGFLGPRARSQFQSHRGWTRSLGPFCRDHGHQQLSNFQWAGGTRGLGPKPLRHLATWQAQFKIGKGFKARRCHGTGAPAILVLQGCFWLGKASKSHSMAVGKEKLQKQGTKMTQIRWLTFFHQHKLAVERLISNKKGDSTSQTFMMGMQFAPKPWALTIGHTWDPHGSRSASLGRHRSKVVSSRRT